MPLGIDLGKIAGDVVDSLADGADSLFTSEEERKRAKLALRSRLMDHKEKLASERAQTLRSETSGAWYQRAWRPLMMLLFGAVIASHWFGLAGENVTPEVQTYLYSIIKLGLGGYVLGRSAEKIAPSVSSAINSRN
jgi:hypothetical protein